MPRYDGLCKLHGVREVVARPDERPLRCDLDGLEVQQIFHPPQFTQDSCRLWRGVNGTRFSHALGAEMPDTRQARDRLAREKGVEFVGKREFLASNKEAAAAVEYHAHVATGGAREEPRATAPANWQTKPAWAKGLV